SRDAPGLEARRPPTVAAAGAALAAPAVVARPFVRALAGARRGVASARPGAARPPGGRWHVMDRRGAVLDERRLGTGTAEPAGPVELRRAERALVRRARRQAGRLVSEPGRSQPACGVGCPAVLPLAVLLRAHARRARRRPRGLPQRARGRRRAFRRGVRTHLGGSESSPGHARAFSDRALLPLCRGSERSALPRQHSPCALAAPGGAG